MKLSIITINYNNAIGLDRTLKSITSLDTNLFEYIVIDGGSTDNSVDIIKQYAKDIDYWISESDKGIYNAMNKGIKHANGEYLLFINSGDIINNDTDIRTVIEHLSGEDIIYFDILLILDKQGTQFIKICPDFIDFRYFIKDALPHQSTFIKREKIIEYGYYDESMKIFGDWAFFMDAICKMQLSYKHVNGYFTTFYEDGISSQPENKIILFNELDQHVREHYQTFNRLYEEWATQKEELHKLRCSRSLKLLKKLGFIKWFNVYPD